MDAWYYAGIAALPAPPQASSATSIFPAWVFVYTPPRLSSRTGTLLKQSPRQGPFDDALKQRYMQELQQAQTENAVQEVMRNVKLACEKRI